MNVPNYDGVEIILNMGEFKEIKGLWADVIVRPIYIKLEKRRKSINISVFGVNRLTKPNDSGRIGLRR